MSTTFYMGLTCTSERNHGSLEPLGRSFSPAPGREFRTAAAAREFGERYLAAKPRRFSWRVDVVGFTPKRRNSNANPWHNE